MSRPTINRKAFPFIGIVVAFLLSGCVTNQYPYAEVGRSTDLIVGIGYAVIDAQPGSSPEQKRLMAIKASKLEAYKSIAEQLYGQYIESRGRLSNSTLEQEELVSRVEGLVLGARLVSIKPISRIVTKRSSKWGDRICSRDWIKRKRIWAWNQLWIRFHP